MINQKQSREADRFAIENLKIPGLILMENAGRGCAEMLLGLGAGHGVVICCGGGNNGGDGFVIARHLYNAGIASKVILFSPPEKTTGDAAVNLRIIEQMKIRIIELDHNIAEEQLTELLTRVGRFSATWIVDAILGTGASGPLREPLVRVVQAINTSLCKRMSIDIPTGMDCDTGTIDPIAVRADITCTFIDAKTGFSNSSARPYVGHVKVIGIGAPASIIVQRGELGNA